MTTVTMGSRVIAPDCSICRAAESVVRSVITHPMVSSVSTWVCAGCYGINARATAALLASDRRLVATEVAA